MEKRVVSFIICFAVMFLVLHVMNDTFQLVWPEDGPFVSARKIYYNALLVALGRTFLVIRWRNQKSKYKDGPAARE